jgi:redox-sensitive bicupin YhaK (pirin superfamily)
MNRHGSFVMNSEQKIIEAIDDFNSGRLGKCTPDIALNVAS